MEQRQLRISQISKVRTPVLARLTVSFRRQPWGSSSAAGRLLLAPNPKTAIASATDAVVRGRMQEK